MKCRGMIMKKYLFSFLVFTNIVCELKIISCPYSFSPEDQRPFFEQYETENSNQEAKKTEENS